MQYQTYLQGNYWQKKRSLKLNQRPYCQICKSDSSLQIHHKRYRDKDGSILFKENLTDLITLCASCHRLTHAHFGINVNKINKKICRIRRLLEFGVLKDKAFWVVARPKIYELLYPTITSKSIVLV
jgi:hypothetical protein